MGLNVFVAYGYRPEDLWIKDMVFPLIGAFGSQSADGKDLYDRGLGDAVAGKIGECDALIAFRTRRDGPTANGTYSTHQWVDNEVGVAFARNLQILEVTETLVNPAQGIAGALQRVTYDRDKRDELMVELVKALGVWHGQLRVQPQLLPMEAERIIKTHKDKAGFSCNYKILRGDQESGPHAAKVLVKRPGGAYVMLKNIRRDDLVEIEVAFGLELWKSDYSRIDDVQITLEKRV